LVTAATQALFQKNFTPGCEEARALGWLLAEVGITAAGEALSRESFGHVGFTGTSLWLDPEYGRCYILLANRTHPQYQDFNMNERRRHFHALAQAVFK
jgi:CubicO group peptidase (beta-lactamase class C family)